jgi:hypothetical protein
MIESIDEFTSYDTDICNIRNELTDSYKNANIKKASKHTPLVFFPDMQITQIQMALSGLSGLLPLVQIDALGIR